jgi:predicted Zn-dependent protease
MGSRKLLHDRDCVILGLAWPYHWTDHLSMNSTTAARERSIATILLLSALMVFIGTANTSESVMAAGTSEKSVTERARELVHGGHTDEAVQLLRATLETSPRDLDARLALANIYAGIHQDDEAQQEFREALRLHPGSPSAEIALGTFYANTGALVAAEKVLDASVREHPKLSEARAELALVEAREHKYKDAEANLRLVAPPADREGRVGFYRLSASIQTGLGQSGAAAHAMEQALQAMPQDETLQLLTAVAEAEAGEWQACLRNVGPLYKSHPTYNAGVILLKAQLAIHQNFESTLQTLDGLDLPPEKKLELRVNLGELLAGANRHEEAAKEFLAASEIAGGHDETLLYNLAVEQYDAGQLDNALATVTALRSEKDSAEVEDLAGDIEGQKGDLAAAVRSHETAVSLAPQEERYRLSLGAELLEYGAYQRAASIFQQAAELFPKSSRIYVGLGMATYYIERYDDSVSAFLRADKLDGGSGRALTYLGATQMDSSIGPSPAAVEAICRRAALAPAEPIGVKWCAALVFRQAYLANHQAAAPDIIRRLREAARLAPDDPVADCSLGHALEWTQQLAEARHWLEICVRLRPDSAEDHYRLSRVDEALGLKQQAAEQADLTEKANAAQDQRQSLAQQFAREGFSEPAGLTDTKSSVLK